MCSTRGFLTALALVLALPEVGRAADVTITFKNVSVSGLDGDILTNRSIHEFYAEEPEEPSDVTQPSVTQPSDKTSTDATKPAERGTLSAQTIPKGPDKGTLSAQTIPKGPDKGTASAQATPTESERRSPMRQSRPRVSIPGPGAGVLNPSFVENGFLVEAFWAVDTGLASGRFVRGHFHTKNLDSGFEGQHFGGSRELHGIFIRAEDGRSFTVKSVRYRVTHNRELGRSKSIVGFSNYDIKVLIATDFTPKLSVLGQFTPFSVGPPISNDLTLPFTTLPVGGFDDVKQVFISSSASVDLEEIVLDVD
jgi:hypothetical protein